LQVCIQIPFAKLLASIFHSSLLVPCLFSGRLLESEAMSSCLCCSCTRFCSRHSKSTSLLLSFVSHLLHQKTSLLVLHQSYLNLLRAKLPPSKNSCLSHGLKLRLQIIRARMNRARLRLQISSRPSTQKALGLEYCLEVSTVYQFTSDLPFN